MLIVGNVCYSQHHRFVYKLIKIGPQHSRNNLDLEQTVTCALIRGTKLVILQMNILPKSCKSDIDIGERILV